MLYRNLGDNRFEQMPNGAGIDDDGWDGDASIVEGSAGLVAFPRSVDDVVACVRAAAAHDLDVVPRGSGTGLAGASTPLGEALVVVTSKMDRILEIRPEDRETAEALDKLYVKTSSGAVPLSQVARFETRPAPLSIAHQGQFPSVTLSFDTAPDVSLGEAITAIEQATASLDPPPIPEPMGIRFCSRKPMRAVFPAAFRTASAARMTRLFGISTPSTLTRVCRDGLNSMSIRSARSMVWKTVRSS